ncbi:MAG: hypothetical protein ACO3YU_07760, partial [Candidatus Nanopelagicales bacterium]
TPWKPIAESRGFLVSFRQFAPPTGPGYSFAQIVYRTADDMQRDIDEATCVALGGENCYAEPRARWVRHTERTSALIDDGR